MYLKCLEVGETLTAANGNKYKVVKFQELSQFIKLPSGEKEIKSNAKPAKRVLWENQDGLFDDFAVGDVTFGDVKKFEVESYVIGEGDDARNVATFTGVQFKSESDSMTAKRYGHTLKEEQVDAHQAVVNKAVVVDPAIVEPAVAIGDAIPT